MTERTVIKFKYTAMHYNCPHCLCDYGRNRRVRKYPVQHWENGVVNELLGRTATSRS